MIAVVDPEPQGDNVAGAAGVGYLEGAGTGSSHIKLRRCQGHGKRTRRMRRHLPAQQAKKTETM